MWVHWGHKNCVFGTGILFFFKLNCSNSERINDICFILYTFMSQWPFKVHLLHFAHLFSWEPSLVRQKISAWHVTKMTSEWRDFPLKTLLSLLLVFPPINFLFSLWFYSHYSFLFFVRGSCWVVFVAETALDPTSAHCSCLEMWVSLPTNWPCLPWSLPLNRLEQKRYV